MSSEGLAQNYVKKTLVVTGVLAFVITGFFSLRYPSSLESYLVACSLIAVNIYLISVVLRYFVFMKNKWRVAIYFILKFALVFGGGAAYLLIRGFNPIGFTLGFFTPFVALLFTAIRFNWNAHEVSKL